MKLICLLNRLATIWSYITANHFVVVRGTLPDGLFDKTSLCSLDNIYVYLDFLWEQPKDAQKLPKNNLCNVLCALKVVNCSRGY